jgi:hypothetical protein
MLDLNLKKHFHVPLKEYVDVATLNRTSNLDYYKPEKYHDQESKEELYARI